MSNERTGVLELTLGDSYIGSAYSPQVEVTDTATGHEVAITYMSPEGIVTERFDVADGEQGPQGPAGYSPTVTITDTPTGHTVTITDEDGPHSYDVPNYAQEEQERQDAWDELSGEVTDAITAAESATSAASTAAQSATGAASSATSAAQAANTAAASANTAASSANAAATAANSAATAAGTAADAATTAASAASSAADDASDAADEARQIAEDIQEELAKKIDGSKGKNLFDMNGSNAIDGAYVVCTSGKISNNATFKAWAFAVDGGSTISINLSSNYHVAFFSQYTDISGMSAGQVVGGYVSGFANESGQNKTVPASAVMMTISIPSTVANSVQVEYGSASTDYERYMVGLPAEDIIGLDEYIGRVPELVVGSGQRYSKIADAVAAAEDGDTILIMPGTYREAVDCRNKRIRLKGFSRDSVKLIYSNVNYQEPPLEITKGVVEDMTIIADGQGTTGGSGAYCAHIDFYQEYNETLQFKNVRFYNDALGIGRPCVGIGLRQNFRLSFVNCEFENALGHTIYCHEQQESNKSNQYVEFIDCSVVSHASQGSAILLQETPALENTSATIRMQRCIVKNLAGGNVIGAVQYGTHPGLIYDGYLGTKLWTLDPASALNSDDQLNA